MNQEDKIREVAFYERKRVEELAFYERQKLERRAGKLRQNREEGAKISDWGALLICCLGLIMLGLIWY